MLQLNILQLEYKMTKTTYQHSETYYCPKCKKRHNSGSIIGTKHLIYVNRTLTKEERTRMIAARKRGLF